MAMSNRYANIKLYFRARLICWNGKCWRSVRALAAQNISICKRNAVIIARPKLIIPRVNFTALTA